MPPFAHAHAGDADWRSALASVLARLDAQRAGRPAPTLGWCYLSDHHAGHADALLAALRTHFPGCAWVGTVGIGVCADGVEYFDSPGLAVMLTDLPREQFRVFSGRRPLASDAGFAPHAALVHADPATPELAGLIGELSERVSSGYLFGGLASSRQRTLSIAVAAQAPADGDADGVFEGGLSGVAFAPEVAIVSRVSQGCQPVGPLRRISESERNVVYALDGEPALDCLLRDLQVDEHQPREALPRLRATLVGLSDDEEAAEFGTPALSPDFATLAPTSEFASAPARRGSFGNETRVRHLIGLDPQRRGVAIADLAEVGQQLQFCRRDTEAARRDLLRIGAEIRSTLEPDELPPAPAPSRRRRGAVAATPPGGRRILGALYFSCTGRGGPHFGAPSAELQLVRHALGGSDAEPVPLVGFFAAGEIGHRHLYGYTGVLTVFTAPG